MIEACICTIGDEIMIGQIVDSNSAYISQQLNDNGIKVMLKTSIGDDYNQIIESLKELTSRYKVVITTGGLGPTKDDITKKALAEVTNSRTFVLCQEQLDIITEIFKRRRQSVSNLNYEQALVPDTCSTIINSKGTAPGMFFKLEDNHLLFSLPGVPYEMEHLLKRVVSTILNYYTPANIIHKSIATFGVPESTLAEMLDSWENSLPSNIKLAYLPSPSTGIRLRLSVYDGEKESNNGLMERYVSSLKEFLGNTIVYGAESDTLDSIVKELLISNSLTLSLAESCTGGEISSSLVSNAGASSFYKGGVVTYSNNSKESILGVPSQIIDKYGAVSSECAESMALSAQKLFSSDISLATTGIAGPSGGSEEKPVGTIWMAVAIKGVVTSHSARFYGDRKRNIIRFTSEALNFLRLKLIENFSDNLQNNNR